MNVGRGLQRVVYSRKNIVGSALALAGVALLFVGVTSGLVGVGICFGLYAIGYLATPAERGVALTMFSTADSHDIEDGLRKLLASIYGRVAVDVFQKVGSIAHSIVEILPSGGHGVDPTDPNINLIRQTALSYLPEALNSYLAIPRIYAERRPVQDGKTAHDVLMDQLNVMDAKMHDVADAIAKNDTDRLMANVRFLQERYASSALEPATVSADSDATTGDARVV